MEPSPSSSSDEDSHHHVRPELRLLTAVNNGKLDQVIAIIEATKAKNSPTDHLLRIGLVRAAERGQAFIAEYLLKNGAKPDGAPFGRSSPLLKAVETNQVQIVRLLLNHGGNVDIADKQGRTALMIAACKNHWHALNELLRRGADVNKKDNKGRNVLHNLAADDDCSWGRDIIHLLLQQNIAIDGPEGQDDSRRSPLHWAVSTGKKELCEMLIMRPTAPRANINAREKKDKTPLHLAVAHGREDIVGLLIHYGADITAKSDGGWTVLHSACQQGSVKILGMLLEAGAEINAQLLNGQTPLHEAVHSGHLEIVKELLLHEECKRAVKDAFGITPFVRAAQKKHKEIIHLLAPFNHVETLSKDALAACTGFNATIIDFGNFPGGKSVQKKAVYEILYGRDVIDPRKPAYNILPRHRKAADFRWIHIPTNNINWIEDLLAKVFIEEGADDVEGYMDLQQSLSYQHGGKLAHSRFMTPACRITTRAQKSADDELSEDAATEQGPPQIFINSRTNVQLKTVPATKPARRNPPKQVSKSNIFFCMPYLHYETDSRRCEMQGAIKRAELSKNGIPSTRAITYDEMLIRAYLVTQNSSLHVRRTLDQSFYHNIDTQTRDRDQVIYRYQLKHNKADSVDPKIFMVDQLWMWTLGKDLIVTSFPQRWQQAKNDPMNVLDNIIETITSRRREPVRTVYDLAMTITECCLGVYDRLCIGDNAFQFLDMFESTLGDATDREDLLFKEFSVASLQASAWLQQRHQRPDRMLGHGTKEAASANIFERFQLVDPSSDPLFVDKLLDISQETMLLAETKDIRDELNMIAIIFRTQQQVLPELEMVIADIYGEQHRSQQSVKKPIREQLRNTEMRMKEIERMDKQAERVYMSVIDLLDLKQKQDANAFEGRMARNQAESTARQSQIIMVFTIVTIIFLPLNFIAAVFAINIREFPRDPNQDGALPLAYVSKYTFGIGFAVSVPMIAIALSLDGMTKSFSEMKRVWREIWPRKRTKNGVRDQEDGRGPTDLDWTLLAEKRTLSTSHAYGHHDRASRE